MQLNKIHTGSALEGLKTLPDQSVHCIVTSPPYWQLRDYGVKGQIGLEKTPKQFITTLVKLFNECNRVLVDTGTLWVNIGDSYSSGGGGGNMKNKKVQAMAGSKNLPGEDSRKDNKSLVRPPYRSKNIKPKDLMGMPWMLAFALRDAGWYLRQDIIWHKPNPMPESVNDRCTKAHEYIFLFSKQKKYYYDAFSIAMPYKDKTLTTFGCESKGSGDGTGMIQSENWANDVKVRKPKVWKMPDGWDTGDGAHGSFHREGREKGKTHKNLDEKGQPLHSMHVKRQETGEEPYTEGGKANKRSVWTVPTAPFAEAHFATFPQELIVDCIKAGCPPGGIVLDPFMGAGTTALVAAKLGRNYIGFELNPEYVKIAERRLYHELGLFTSTF